MRESDILTCLLVRNRSYTAAEAIKPRGVMVHSTGCNNPSLRRYVQPAVGQEGYEELMALLGRNANGNHWNRPLYGKNAKSAHAFIGLLADGTVAAVQTLPWDIKAWHCAGTANGTHIGFEICEDGLEDGEYFRETYRLAAELTAYLCGLWDLDPLSPGTVIGHGEGYRLGVASKRGVDRDPWFGPFGRTMDDFRAEVAEILQGGEILRYNTVDEIREQAGWALETVLKLIRAGALRGEDDTRDAEGYPARLGLTPDALKLLVINDRMGIYG